MVLTGVKPSLIHIPYGSASKSVMDHMKRHLLLSLPHVLCCSGFTLFLVPWTQHTVSCLFPLVCTLPSGIASPHFLLTIHVKDFFFFQQSPLLARLEDNLSLLFFSTSIRPSVLSWLAKMPLWVPTDLSEDHGEIHFFLCLSPPVDSKFLEGRGSIFIHLWLSHCLAQCLIYCSWSKYYLYNWNDIIIQKIASNFEKPNRTCCDRTHSKVQFWSLVRMIA